MQSDMNKFNVLFIPSTKGTHGVSFNLTRLAVALKKVGHQVVVVSDPKEQEKGLFKELKSRGVKCYTLCGLDNLSTKTISAARIMGKIIDNYDIVVIHAQGIRHLLVAFFASKLFSRGKDTGIVVSLHTLNDIGIAGSSYENMVLLIASFLLNTCADLAIAVAEFVAKKLIRFRLRRSKIRTVYNGIDLDLLDEIVRKNDDVAWLPSNFEPSSCIVVGYFARLVPLKGHTYLFEAISRLSKEFPVKLVIAGDGPLRDELKKQSRTLGIEEDVLFLGWIDHTRLYQLLNVIDIYVFPSLAEMFPFAILEAMASGKPVVATRVGGVPEVIRDGEDGILVPPRDSKSLADAIKRLINNPTEAEQMGKKSRKLIEEKFDLRRIAYDLSECYQLCIKRKPW